jgi:hypothetical protein
VPAEARWQLRRVLERDPAYRAELARCIRPGAPDGVPATAEGPVAEPQDLLPQRAFGVRTRAPGRDFEPEPLVAVTASPRRNVHDIVDLPDEPGQASDLKKNEQGRSTPAGLMA